MATSEALAASIGGAISTGILYPIDVYIKQLQLSSNTCKSGVAVSSSSSSSIYHTNLKNQPTAAIDSNQNNNNNNNNKLLLCWSILLRIRHHLQNKIIISSPSVLKYYWYGIDIAILQNVIEKYISIMIYTTLKQYHEQYYFRYCYKNRPLNQNITTTATPIDNHNNATATTTALLLHILYGYIAQWIHVPITLPLETYKTQIQIYNMNRINNTATIADEGTTTATPNTTTTPTITNLKWEIFFRMLYPQDYQNNDPDAITVTTNNDDKIIPQKYIPRYIHLYYSGISSYFILSWKPAIQYTIYEFLKHLRIQQRQRTSQNTTSTRNTTSTTTSVLSYIESFVFAIIARSIATIIVYPYIRRRLLQLQSQTNSDTASVTTTCCGGHRNDTDCGCKADETYADKTQVRQMKLLSPLPQPTVSPYSRLLLLPNSMSIWICHILKYHLDNTSYQGVGPELIRGAISSVITFLVQEYILQLQWTNNDKERKIH